MTSKGDPSEESLCCVALADVLEAVFVALSLVLDVAKEALEPDVVGAATDAPVLLDITEPVEAIMSDAVGPVYVARIVSSASSALCIAFSDSGWPSVSQAACQALRDATNARGSLSASQPCLTQEVREVKVESVAWGQTPSIRISFRVAKRRQTRYSQELRRMPADYDKSEMSFGSKSASRLALS